MKKKGGFLSGLVVFILIIIILGGVGYLGFNIINNASGMAGMNMASETTSTNASDTDSGSSKTPSEAENSDGTATDAKSTFKISQINQVMLNKQALDKAYTTVKSALEKMTLDPYATDAKTSSSMSNQMNDMSMSDTGNATSDSKTNTTVNIYTDGVNNQSMQMQNMGQTYDAVKMQQLHSGLYKVSVGMQLLKQLQYDIAEQIEKASIDTSSETEYYMNQYYKTVQNKDKLNSAMTYINEAVDLININPYVDANGLVYDSERMTGLHDSIYIIAEGVVDLNELNSDLLTQAVNLGNLAQNAYNIAQQNQSTDTMSNMNMTTSSSLNISTIVTIVLIAFVAIFLIGMVGSIVSLFKTGTHPNTSGNSTI